jgi:uncharacterized protein (DUF983 family)
MVGMDTKRRKLWPSIGRGLKGRCPECAQGSMFKSYLKVNETCPRCGHRLAQYPADDGPAYLTILLVGHFVVGPSLFFPIVWEAPPLYTVPISLVVLATVTLLLLPRVKGGWIGLMYALKTTDADSRLHTADYAE